MDGLVLMLLATVAMAVLGMLSLAYGVDSRDGIGDDHARSVGG